MISIYIQKYKYYENYNTGNNRSRQANQAREISIETDVNIHAEGSALVKFGFSTKAFNGTA